MDMSKVSRSISELIGNTPMLKINRMIGTNSANIFAKLESFNIGGSIKDRVALHLIEFAEASGILTKEKTIIEATSGNTGIAIAMIGAAKGYKVTIVMSESVSVERRKIISAYGADLILTPGSRGTSGAIEIKDRLVREDPDKYVPLDQFSNPANVLAHYRGTGREIIDQMNGEIDMVVLSVGTGGTSSGVSLRMKEFNPAIKVIGITPRLGVKIQGIRNPKEPNPSKLVRYEAMDELIEIDEKTKQEAFETGRRAAREEGLLLGMSAAVTLHIATLKAIELGPGKNIIAILPDNGFKYLSTELFQDNGRLVE
ncbi:MAG: PLP-dependent cysteine synthase family protein [Candidatus Thermoplasmatota archaeon]|nr:PLP-dependent cysteine synthase family protein [Candidatus Thermoplasmatota archaeon]